MSCLDRKFFDNNSNQVFFDIGSIINFPFAGTQEITLERNTQCGSDQINISDLLPNIQPILGGFEMPTDSGFLVLKSQINDLTVNTITAASVTIADSLLLKIPACECKVLALKDNNNINSSVLSTSVALCSDTSRCENSNLESHFYLMKSFKAKRESHAVHCNITSDHSLVSYCMHTSGSLDFSTGSALTDRCEYYNMNIETLQFAAEDCKFIDCIIEQSSSKANIYPLIEKGLSILEQTAGYSWKYMKNIAPEDFGEGGIESDITWFPLTRNCSQYDIDDDEIVQGCLEYTTSDSNGLAPLGIINDIVQNNNQIYEKLSHQLDENEIALLVYPFVRNEMPQSIRVEPTLSGIIRHSGIMKNSWTSLGSFYCEASDFQGGRLSLNNIFSMKSTFENIDLDCDIFVSSCNSTYSAISPLIFLENADADTTTRLLSVTGTIASGMYGNFDMENCELSVSSFMGAQSEIHSSRITIKQDQPKTIAIRNIQENNGINSTWFIIPTYANYQDPPFEDYFDASTYRGGHDIIVKYPEKYNFSIDQLTFLPEIQHLNIANTSTSLVSCEGDWVLGPNVPYGSSAPKSQQEQNLSIVIQGTFYVIPGTTHLYLTDASNFRCQDLFGSSRMHYKILASNSATWYGGRIVSKKDDDQIASGVFNFDRNNGASIEASTVLGLYTTTNIGYCQAPLINMSGALRINETASHRNNHYANANSGILEYDTLNMTEMRNFYTLGGWDRTSNISECALLGSFEVQPQFNNDPSHELPLDSLVYNSTLNYCYGEDDLISFSTINNHLFNNSIVNACSISQSTGTIKLIRNSQERGLIPKTPTIFVGGDSPTNTTQFDSPSTKITDSKLEIHGIQQRDTTFQNCTISNSNTISTWPLEPSGDINFQEKIFDSVYVGVTGLVGLGLQNSDFPPIDTRPINLSFLNTHISDSTIAGLFINGTGLSTDKTTLHHAVHHIGRNNTYNNTAIFGKGKVDLKQSRFTTYATIAITGSISLSNTSFDGISRIVSDQGTHTLTNIQCAKDHTAFKADNININSLTNFPYATVSLSGNLVASKIDNQENAIINIGNGYVINQITTSKNYGDIIVGVRSIWNSDYREWIHDGNIADSSELENYGTINCHTFTLNNSTNYGTIICHSLHLNNSVNYGNIICNNLSIVGSAHISGSIKVSYNLSWVNSARYKNADIEYGSSTLNTDDSFDKVLDN